MGQYKMFENLMKSMNRNKRAADDLFELGDRLTEKLQQKTEEMKAKMGNASCVLKELDIIDQNENLDVSGMVQSIENGENSKTNGSKNNTSRTAVPAQPLPKLSQNLFSPNVLMEKNGEKS